MKRNLTFLLATALALCFSAFALAQQPTATDAKQPAKTPPKTMMAHKEKMEHMKLNKEEITALQNALSKNGFYKGTANGVIDTATQRALREYQKANKLKVTGAPDKATLDKLGVAYTMPHAKPAEHSMQKKAELPTNQPQSHHH